jgi:hydroxylamine reductase
MQMLDEGHTRKFGAPSPTTVFEGTRPGPGILVTGHDMLDLSDVLEQSAGSGVSVYTHGEMLPAHMYPELRKHDHLVGHFGGAWQKQKSEFQKFTGSILATTNCVLIPKEEYRDRLFTTRVTAVPGGMSRFAMRRTGNPRSGSTIRPSWGWRTRSSRPSKPVR